jgi:site-specific recombinase XerD
MVINSNTINMSSKNNYSILNIQSETKSELSLNIKKLQEETLLNLKNSKAANTVRAYKSDFNDFNLFCNKNGFKSLPSEPKIVSLYLTHLSSNNIKMSTLKRRLVSIGVIHKYKGII